MRSANSDIKVVANAFSDPSAEIPRLSRKSIAGSSARSVLTVSTLLLESHRGIVELLCRHRSGWSVFKHSCTQNTCRLEREAGSGVAFRVEFRVEAHVAYECDADVFKDFSAVLVLQVHHL